MILLCIHDYVHKGKKIVKGTEKRWHPKYVDALLRTGCFEARDKEFTKGELEVQEYLKGKSEGESINVNVTIDEDKKEAKKVKATASKSK